MSNDMKQKKNLSASTCNVDGQMDTKLITLEKAAEKLSPEYYTQSIFQGSDFQNIRCRKYEHGKKEVEEGSTAAGIHATYSGK